jgi:hypothetical protein
MTRSTAFLLPLLLASSAAVFACEEDAPVEKVDDDLDAEDPDAEDPDAEDPDAEDPDAEDPDAEDPDAEDPDAEDPDDDEPGKPNVDAGKSDAGKSDAGKSDAGKSDAGKSDAGTPDTGKSDAGKSDAGKSDAGTPGPVDPGDDDRPSCVKKPSQVVIIGDSYINWPTHALPSDLATASGQQGWRLHAVGGASMATGGIAGFIPDQFDLAIAGDKDVHTVVMDGGGNDVLLPDVTLDPLSECKNSAQSPTLKNCQDIVQRSGDTVYKLAEKMAAAGVRDVVYFFYPNIPEGTLLGGASPNQINKYSKGKMEAVCAGIEDRTKGKLRCHFVDMVPVFEGHPGWFFPGDIHPTGEGSAAMGKAIWAKMKDECVGQPESSGCCKP